MRTRFNNPRPRDIQGREYARLSQLKAGDRVQVDRDFTCIIPFSIRIVREDEQGLYIKCIEGNHYLDGQLDEADGDDQILIGIYPAPV